MAQRVHALLVGINDYPAEVGRLAGCLHDVDRFAAYLKGSFAPASLAIEQLKDGEATRENVIAQFRAHLGQARDGDVAVFYYAGHGARWKSAAAFREFYPDGRDEGLVCIDSRRPGGYDLADKELALLVAEVAANGAHATIILDSCHSGSGTRGADAFRGLRPRLTREVTDERPLATYIGGHYAALQAHGTPLYIPASRHMLLAACDRQQLAQETDDAGGIFSRTLVEVLEKSGSGLSYAELFVRCRAAVRRYAQDQDPQFEALGDFDAASGFLGRAAAQTSRRFSVFFDTKSRGWAVGAGAIHGLPTDLGQPVTLKLYPEDDPGRPAGTATVVQVGAQQSAVKLGFDAVPVDRYRAELASLPVPQLPVLVTDAALAAAVQKMLDTVEGTSNVLLTDVAASARYGLAVQGDALLLRRLDTGWVVQGARLTGRDATAAAADLMPVFDKIDQWERSLRLRNPSSRLDTARVTLGFEERRDDGNTPPHDGDEIELDYPGKPGEEPRKVVRGRFTVRNDTRQTLYMLLIYYSADFQIANLRNDPVQPGESMTLWGEKPDDYFYIEDDVDETIERFKLVVSTEPVDDFLMTQEGVVRGAIIEPLPVTRGGAAGMTGRGVGTVKPIEKKLANEWFTIDRMVRVVRRLEQVGRKDAPLAGGKIVVKAHPSVTADLSLGAAATASRGVGTSAATFYRAFEQRGIALLNFAGTRGDDQSVLELTGIQNAAALKDQPLEIRLNVPLKDNEAILPLVYDGQHVLLGGQPSRADDGSTVILIDTLPEVEGERRRSLGGSLKLYFFKTYLKQDNVNLLRWVEYRPDGSFVHQKSGVADKVNAAKNILLMIHGITGDTETMAQGIKACGVADRFDLVLTYDYENLATPIDETARKLKAQLAGVGLDEKDDRRLTLLVHSMGGLVSRWFIEREGGNRVVDHLVMCGTPNNGSPFGRIDDARKIITMLTGLSMNYLPTLVPFSSAVLFALNRSKKVTPALEMMNPSSPFITALNQSEDPGIPYTILAGDIEAYREPSDAFFAKMVAKAGQSLAFSALFGGQANDIAVGVNSILGVGGARAKPPVRHNVACHHMNYFISEPGQKALNAVSW